MRHIITLSFLAFLLGSCGSSNKYSLVKGAKADAPDANLRINDSIYIDYLEISFLAYSEYQFYLDRIYGLDSKQSKFAALDTTVISQLRAFAQSSESEYGETIDVETLPVVGITYEQAQAYTKWRTAVVLENSLVEAGLLYPYKEQDEKSHFTPEVYFSGKFTGYKPANMEFLVFRLPTEEEWDVIYSKAMDTTQTLNTIAPTYEDKSQAVQFINDNVSEMIATKGVAKGGNWLDGGKEHIYEGSEVWLGFRCVADLMSSEDYMKRYAPSKKRGYSR